MSTMELTGVGHVKIELVPSVSLRNIGAKQLPKKVGIRSRLQEAALASTRTSGQYRPEQESEIRGPGREGEPNAGVGVAAILTAAYTPAIVVMSFHLAADHLPLLPKQFWPGSGDGYQPFGRFLAPFPPIFQPIRPVGQVRDQQFQNPRRWVFDAHDEGTVWWRRTWS